MSEDEPVAARSTPATHPPRRASLPRPTLDWFVAGAIGAIAAVAVLAGIRGDLPYPPDVDEPTFVRAAVHVAIGHLSTGWYGHPGSTVIYSAAALFRLWAAVQDPRTLFHLHDAAIAKTLASDPAPLYLIARGVSGAYTVLMVVAAYALARRLTGPVAAAFAALVVAVAWIVISYGQLARDDTAGACFALLFLLALLVAIDNGRPRDFALAAVLLGLAISTRYFLVSLAPPFVVACFVASPNRGVATRRAAWLFMAVATFIITSPGVFLHPAKALADILAEARAIHPGADGLSPLGNATWYLGTVLPGAVGVAILPLAAAGAAIAWRLHRSVMVVLGTYAITYLSAVSLSPLHWDRYIIPLIPVVSLAAAIAIDRLAIWSGPGMLALRSGQGDKAIHGRSHPRGWAWRRTATAIVVAALAVASLVPQADATLTRDALRGAPTTRAAATDWIRSVANARTVLCEEMYTAYADGLPGRVVRVFALGQRSLEWYRGKGCTYLLESSTMSGRFVDAARYPSESAFYISLTSLPLAMTFEPGPTRGGPTIHVYRLAPTG